MKYILSQLINHKTLTQEEAKQVLINISRGEYNASQMAAFMTIFMMRSITIEELTGFREALLELCVPINFSNYETIDLCGTGGDGKDTFNISTLSSFVVAKHGNYGVSSISGSSNVMENLGVKFSNQQDYLEKCIEEANIAILHAPLFHPAMKNVGSIRKELGVKTFFNMLGPMVNPSFPKNQLVGVFSLELARMYAYLYQNTTTNFSILYDLEGFDEVSLTGNVKIISNSSEKILKPEDFNAKSITLQQIKGGETIEEAAKIFITILSGKGTTMQNEVVIANAALAIAMMKKTGLEESLVLAKESLMGGKALGKLKMLQKISLQ
jgi:anthranilate phosphoribosyltransferase